MVLYGGPKNPNVLESKRVTFKELEVFGISAGGKNFSPEGPFKKLTIQCADRTQPRGPDGRHPVVFIEFFGIKGEDGKVEPFHLRQFRDLNEIDEVNRTGKNYVISLPKVQYRKVKSEKAKRGFYEEYSIDSKIFRDPDFKLIKIVERPAKKTEAKSA